MKRSGDGLGDRGAAKQGRLSRYGQHAFKILCPESMVAKLMGDKGGEIHAIEDQTSTHLQFSPRGEFYPNTRFRVLTIVGQESGFVFDALLTMLDQVIAWGQEEKDPKFADEYVDQNGRIVFRCALSKAAAGAIIGSKGERIKRLRESSGASIDIDREVVDSHQMVTLAGTKAQLVDVLDEMNTTVQADHQEDWFQQWAGQRSVSVGVGGATLGPRGERGPPGGGGGPRSFAGDPGDSRRRGHDSLKHKGCTIFVGRLAQATTTEHLSKYFSAFGEVVDADVRTDPSTGRSKGFGFITFARPESVTECLDRKMEHELDGRWVDVKRYGEQDDRQESGFEVVEEDLGIPPAPVPVGHSRVGERFAERDIRVPPPPPRSNGWGRGDARGSVQWFADLASTVNPEYFQLDYCITCSLPSAKCGALIGRRGEHVTEVQRTTGAEIVISKKDPNESADAHRTVTITGPLLSVYGAHMLLMRHYNDEEALFQSSQQQHQDTQRVEELQRKLAELTEELAHAQGRGPSRGPGPRPGGSGRVPPPQRWG